MTMDFYGEKHNVGEANNNWQEIRYATYLLLAGMSGISFSATQDPIAALTMITTAACFIFRREIERFLG